MNVININLDKIYSKTYMINYLNKIYHKISVKNYQSEVCLKVDKKNQEFCRSGQKF